MALLAACGGSALAPASSTPTTSSKTASSQATAPAGGGTTPPVSPTSAPASGATSAPASAGAKTGGTLTVTLSDLGTQNLDVILAATNNNIIYLSYEPLVRYNQNGELIPWLAESWEMSKDGRLWTFKLRKNVKFSNGDDFTSADAKFSIERFVSDQSKSAWSPMHRQTVDHVETPDAYTVQVSAKSPPYVFYADAIAGTTMISKNYFEKVGVERFAAQPMGTGPWNLTSFAQSSTAELEVNKSYWGTKPVWDNLVVRHVPEEATRIAMLKRGEADIVGVSWDNAITLRGEGYELRQTKASTIPGLFTAGYWLQPGPTSDQNVREAMDIAINRQELSDLFFRGFAKPAAGNFQLTELHWGFDPIWYTIKYEPARAKELLKQAGYPGKFKDPTIKVFSVAQVGWEPDFLQVISGYWEAVGIQTQLVPMDFTAMRGAWVAGDPSEMGGVVTWIGVGSGTASNAMPSQQNTMTSTGVNHGAGDPELDRMFFDTIAELDPEKRLEKWHKVQQKAFSLHSVMGVCRVYDQFAVSNKVGEWNGMTYLSNGLMLGLAGVQHR
jgi:peptide/nickel transport system substrate-binding protein